MSAPARKRALVLAEQDLDQWYARYLRGETPSPLPYGVHALEQHGYAIHGARRDWTGALGKARDVVEHRSGVPIERALRGWGRAAEADLVIALLEHQARFAALLKRARISPYRRVPLLIWSCWLADDVRRADSAGRQRLLRQVEAADLITHMSRHETEILTDLGIPAERLLTIDFGIDHHYYTPDPLVDRDLEVLAVGQDRGRDYGTLFAAVAGSGLTVDLVCKPENLAGLRVPDNVRVHAPVSLPEYRALLRRARIVAVPTHELAYPTGQSVALEASATGACVAVTGTRAMADYFSDGGTARLVPVGDADAWRDTLTELAADPDQRARLGRAAHAAVQQRYNADLMWASIAAEVDRRGILTPR